MVVDSISEADAGAVQEKTLAEDGERALFGGPHLHIMQRYEQGVPIDILVRDAAGARHYGLFLLDFINFALDVGADPTLMADALPMTILRGQVWRLLEAGATIDIERLLAFKYPEEEIVYHADLLLDAGVSSEQIVERLNLLIINQHCRRLLAAGVDTSTFISYLEPSTIATHLPLILSSGVTVDLSELYRTVKPSLVAAELSTFISAGADINVRELFESLSVPEQARYLRQFLEVGLDVNVEKLVARIRPKDKGFARGWLIAAGVDVKSYGAGFQSRKKKHQHPERNRSDNDSEESNN